MALAAILNPIGEMDALVFYYSQQQNNYNLAVRQASLTGGRDAQFDDRNTNGGHFKPPPSDITVANFLGQVRVHGIGKIPKSLGSSDPPVAVATQLSPAFNPIDKPSSANVQPGEFSAITSCGNSTGNGYVSFFKEVNGDLSLITYTITKTSSSPADTRADALRESKLTSIVVRNEPWIFYQASRNRYIRYYNKSQDSTTTINSTGTCAEGSHLAVVFSAIHPDLLFLYFRNLDGDIVRVWHRDGRWSAAPEKVSSHPMDVDSSIALVAYADAIHVFFWNDEDIVHEINELPDESQLLNNVE